ncbi:MAG: 3-methyl-2-oxobutanoate hydroxymethyltransferase [Kangiellaceae bacterium]|jgi:3-methyl-2-oxobutanoate hydroxymethyltransferase
MKRQTLHSIQQLKDTKEPIAVLTAYDASFAKLVSEAGIEIILVGDSLGMVMQGHQSTVPVSMENMQYHTQCVANGNRSSLIVADLPYMSYATEQESMSNAAKLMQAGANMVKLEGGEWLCPTVSLLTERGIPVCAHLGLTPQSVDALGGFKIQGRDEENANQILRDALAIEKAGAKLLVLECVPAILAEKITRQLQIPTIGIGAGNKTDGQVLVLQDMLGMNNDFKPKFVRNFFAEPEVNSVQQALQGYLAAVKDRSFPAKEHCFE